jgi:hypothetical protein
MKSLQRSSALSESEYASWGSGELGTPRASNGEVDDAGDETGDTSYHGSTVDVNSCGNTVGAGGSRPRIPECDGAKVMCGAGIELVSGVQGSVGEVGAADSGQLLSSFQGQGTARRDRAP